MAITGMAYDDLGIAVAALGITPFTRKDIGSMFKALRED